MSDQKPVYSETVRRVYVEGESTFLSVGPWPEAPEFLALYTEGDKNREWFGHIETSMTPAYARALGRALIAAADEMESNTK